MSFGAGESKDSIANDTHFTGTSIVFFAATGNTKGAVNWPASSPYVVAVGGTTLTLNSDGSVASEVACSTSSSGVSSNEPMPAYQSSFGLTGSRRTIPDVSYHTGSGSRGYPICCSTGWTTVTGTSAGAPQWAAICAIGRTASLSNLYSSAKSSYSTHFRDIISGSNAYSAATGYDLATGLGSPLTANFGASIVDPLPEGSELAMFAAAIVAALFVCVVKRKK